MPSTEASGPPSISIVIVTYNSANVIASCLQSVARDSRGLQLETLVVDNGSQDATPRIVKHQFPWVQVIEGHGNIGFAAGNHLGFSAARGRYLFMLNPDTELHPGALQALLNFAKLHPEAGMIAPHLINQDGSLQHSTFRFPDLRQAFFGFFEKLVPIDSPHNGRYSPQAYAQSREVDHIIGAAVFFRREVWRQTGGMDENYNLYFEETDWCYRAKQTGWQLLYTPNATIMHMGAHTTSKDPESSSVMFARSQVYFYRKNYGWLRYVALKTITIVGLSYWLARTVHSLIRCRVSPMIFKNRLKSYLQILLS